MNKEYNKVALVQNLNLLARAYPIDEQKGLISKKLIVPPGKIGIAVFRDGRTDLFTSGDNRVITVLDRLTGKGGGFWAGYIPAENFNASVSITNLLSGDDKIHDLNILCDINVEDKKKFFLDVVVPHREIPNQTLVLDLPEIFSSFASLIRNYSSEDLVGGQLDDVLYSKAQTLLALILPSRGIKLERVTLISIWNQEDRLAIEEQLLILDQKMKDLEFDKKLAEVEDKHELDQLLSDNGIQLPERTKIIPLEPGNGNTNRIKNWIRGLNSDDQPGHNFRLKSLLIKKEAAVAPYMKKPIPKSWWVYQTVWMVTIILSAIGATINLDSLSTKIEWLGQPWVYAAIWIPAIGVVVKIISNLYKKWEKYFRNEEKHGDVLGLDSIKSNGKAVIDQVVREQIEMELSLQRNVLNELRSRVFRQGKEDLALEIKRLERKLEDFIPMVSDTKIGRPIYLHDGMKLSKKEWDLLMNKEEIVLVKAASLSEEVQSIQALANDVDKIPSRLTEYETRLDVLHNDFMGRERLLNTTIVD